MPTKKILQAALLILTVLFFVSCQKQPTASFSLDKSVYNAGETVVITNSSTDAHHYEWNLPGNSTSTEENPVYVIPETAAGILTFKLTAFSRNNELSSESLKSINVIPKTGNAVFWQSEGYDNITVTINSVTENILDKITTAPDCGHSDCANFAGLVVGTHNYTANDGVYFWQGQIEIVENQCTVVKLNYSDATQQ
ncbi:MAG TPA: hypothetical protein PLZ52_07760 [Bacteroidales bacterium]|nr:hypothetical protein [Bacteroidales bacterium]HQL69585.1 hypothetical protein [Bacteroidales bacterium]